MDILLPSTSKCTYLNVLTKDRDYFTMWDWVHCYVILSDYGKRLYRESSQIAMCTALDSCIKGYESLYIRTDMLQADILIGNFMINKDNNNPFW